MIANLPGEPKTKLTIEDFEKLPQELAENHELVDGELIDVSGNIGEHNELRDELLMRLKSYVREHNAGRVMTEQDFDFGGNAHGPDVSFFSNAKLALLDLQRRVQRFVPDLAIEIVSRNDLYTELMRKVRRYRAHGTSEVWVLDKDARNALVLAESADRILGENDVLETPLIPGFSIRVGELYDESER